MTKINTGNANREYKDRLFRFVFGAEENKAYLLSLCNAVSGTDYTDVDDIEITTLIYVSSLQKIPTPRYYVFYNGTEKQPDVVKLKLSDAFQVPDDSGEFEWTATMLNINYGHNRELLEQCQPLYEYAHFIKLVREYSEAMELKKAIDKAVEKAREWKCIGTFLYQCKSEVSVMLLTEFDEKKHEDNLIKLGEKEGREKERMKNICSMLALSLSPEIIAKACEVSVDYVLNLKKELESKTTS